jgi:diguanylate cyclase (GGDEF)-like protein
MTGVEPGDRPGGRTNGAAPEQPDTGLPDSAAQGTHQRLDDHARALANNDTAAADGDQTAAGGDQTAADSDQTAADTDQTTADSDQTAAESDQAAADSDQAAADIDQAASDRDLMHGGDRTVHQSSREVRDRSTRQRYETTRGRFEVAADRDQVAVARDQSAHVRDLAASTRDQAAELRAREQAARDAALPADHHSVRTAAAILHAARNRKAAAARQASVLERRVRSAADREHAARDREQAARDREHAARDRDQGARDRDQAEKDRRELMEQLAIAETDELTGTRARAAGLLDLDHEIDRARRATSRLAVAYVDVVALKACNDTFGHAAGDALLQCAVGAIRLQLRSYDLIIRLGGDEFLCVMSGATIEDAQDRFTAVEAALADDPEPCEIKVGIAELAPQDTAAELIQRADVALPNSPRR